MSQCSEMLRGQVCCAPLGDRERGFTVPGRSAEIIEGGREFAARRSEILLCCLTPASQRISGRNDFAHGAT